MVDMKGLPEKITTKMTKTELTKYEKLQKEWIKAGEDMDKAQGASTDYSRKYIDGKNPTAAQKKKDQELVNAGFKAEHYAFKKADEYRDFVDTLKKKYGSTSMSSQEKMDRKLITVYTRACKKTEERIEKVKVRMAKYKREGKTELYTKYKNKLRVEEQYLKRNQKLLKELKNKYSI